MEKSINECKKITNKSIKDCEDIKILSDLIIYLKSKTFKNKRIKRIIKTLIKLVEKQENNLPCVPVIH